MTIFKTETQQGVWIEQWCVRCYRTRNGVTVCPILDKALSTGRKPPEWIRKQRAQTIENMIKCTQFGTKPPVARRGKQYEDVPMFDVNELDCSPTRLVPVPGWPDHD